MATIAVTAIASAGQAMAGSDNQDTVVVKGAKRVRPTDAPPALELYAKPPVMEQIALSPDGSRVAFMTRVGDMRILAGYRFSDHQRVYYKVAGGNVSAISWADEDHVLVSDSRMTARGTCEGGIGITGRQMLTARDLPAPAPAAQGKPGDSAAQGLDSQAQALLDANKPPRCAYFGVRGENAITSVNMVTGQGKPIGAHIGDAPSQALGFPSRISTGGTPGLIGPFLEIRGVSSGSQPADRVFLWKVDPETGHGKLVEDGGGDIERENRYVDDWLFDRDGTIIARALYDFRRETYRIEMRTAGTWKPVLSREIVRGDNTFAPVLIGLAGDGKSIVLLNSDTHGKDAKDALRHFHYYGLNGDGVFSGPLEKGDAGQVRPIFDPGSGRLTGFASQAEGVSYDIQEPQLRDLYQKALAAAPGQAAEVVSVTDDGQKVLIHANDTEDTGSYYLLDFATGKSTTVGEDFPQVPTEWIAGQEVYSYTAGDGTSVSGILTLPPKLAQKSRPLVVLPHDGPEGQDSLGFNWLSQALASRGYVVFQPNYRGSDGRGADFVAAGYGQWDGKILSDIKDGIDALVRQGVATPERVCMVGIGFGGYAALKAAENGNVRCAVSLDGISDAERYLAWRKTFAPAPDPDAFASLSPSPAWPRTFRNDPASLRSLSLFAGTHASAVSASAIAVPVLLIHQDGDGLVPVAQSRALYNQMQKAGKQVDYRELKGNAHTPDTEAVRLTILQTLTAFLDANNPVSK
ncbi:MAG: S9 family peptidase [Asticcacaulis sp.]|nr:S9 family peptidase [Asticcacaulis sp.]